MSFDKIDRRRFIRIKFPFTIHLYPGGKPPISVYTENIGMGGVKVTLRQKLEVSSLINLEIYVKLRPVVCKGKIAWVNKRESEFLEGEIFFDTGMKFQGLKPDEEEAIEEHLNKVMQDRKARGEVEV